MAGAGRSARPGARPGRRAEVAALAPRELAPDGQAEPEAALAAGAAAALEALEDQVALVRGHARARVVDRDRGARAPRRPASPGRRCPRARSAARCRAGCAGSRAMAPGSPRPQHGPVGGATSSATPPPRRAALELGADRAGQLAQLDGLAAQLDLGVEAAEVQQLGGQAAEPRSLRPGAGDLLAGVVEVERRPRRGRRRAARASPERRQGRAQLVRRGGDEGAPGLLLAQQRGLHRRERAAPGRRSRRDRRPAAAAARRRRRAVICSAARRRRRSAAHERRRRGRAPRSERHREADERGRQEGAAAPGATAVATSVSACAATSRRRGRP